MALRKNTNPREMDLQSDMREILMRNGLQAHIVANGDRYQLAVQSHDSPLMTYNLTERQMLALTDWGTNSANKKAYNVLTSMIGNDFHMPRNFVYARNANGRVAMGLHGYRIGTGEYGRSPYTPVGRGQMFDDRFLGWTPRRQEGFHMRRVGGQLFYQGAPMVGERPDRRLKPGEMQSGGYGFYWKGNQQQQQVQQPNADVLLNLQAVITPVVNRPRSEEPAKPYKEIITSPVYFSNEKWQDVLSSHGIIVDEQAKTLTIQSSKANVDMVYDLNDEELKTLTANSIKDVPVDKRLEVLNNVIKDDFADKITMESLNSKERIGIALSPAVLQELTQREQQNIQMQQPMVQAEQAHPEQHLNGDAVVDGRDLDMLNENKGWFREGKHGREVSVEEIAVQKIEKEPKPDVDQQRRKQPKENEATYRMTAVINGQSVSHEISQKDYNKFLALDDYHRMALFSKIFKEVDLKSRPEAHRGLGGKILAALTAGAVVTGEFMHGLQGRGPRPEIYSEHFGGGPKTVSPYFKPGVDSPQDIAARNFEAQANKIVTDMRLGR